MAAEDVEPCLPVYIRGHVPAFTGKEFEIVLLAETEGSAGYACLHLLWLRGGIIAAERSVHNSDWGGDDKWFLRGAKTFPDIHEALDYASTIRHETDALSGLLDVARDAAFDEGAAADSPIRKIRTWVQLRDAVRDGELDPAEVARLMRAEPAR
jgi:hypothetical protein